MGHEPEKKTSYVMEMLGHQYNLYALLSSLAAGALVSIPFGFEVGTLPLIAYAAGAGLAALFIPSHRGFKEAVDRRKRSEVREKTRKHLQGEVQGRVGPEDSRYAIYRRMRERLESLEEVANNRKTSLTLHDVERLNDATVDFLGLWLARLVIDERQRTFDEGSLKHRLNQILDRLETATGGERGPLIKAKGDLERVLDRRERLASREAAIDAAMVVMADTFDEVFQRVMTNPTSGDITRQLQEAVDRMRIEEELGSALGEEIELLDTRHVAARARTRTGA